MLQKHKSVSKNSFQLEMDNNSISLSPTTTHLGILRAETRENIINIEERLSLARRTLYALINTGVHGSNGFNPKVSLKIYQCYGIRVVSPTFPFALESFRPLSLSPRVVSPPGRFAYFPVRP